MTKDLRWRFMTLQAVLVVAFAFGAGFSFWASGYVHSQITDQMKAQQITFPAQGDAGITAAALTPCSATTLPKNFVCPIATGHSVGVANSKAMNQYAGQIMTNGDQARTYANSFINVHLSNMGYTYSKISELALTTPSTDKNYASYQALANTIFKGTTLRSMLLNAYGWWSFGSYIGDAAVVLVLASVAVLFALVYEALVAYRQRSVTVATRGLATRAVGA